MTSLPHISNEALAQALEAETTFQGVCTRLGLKHSRYATKALRKRASALNLDFSGISAYSTPFSDKQRLSNALQGATSYSDVLRNLGVNPAGDNRSTLKRYVAKFGLDISSVENGQRQAGLRASALRTARGRPLSEVLVENSTASRKEVKRRVIAEGLLAYACRKCSNPGVWDGEALVLSLEHKNGVNDDHRLENLEFLCPNCHSQTPTFAGRNIKKPLISSKTLNVEKRKAAAAANQETQTQRLIAIKSAGLNFHKKGWATQAGRIIGMSPQKVVPWLRKTAPEFLATCWLRGQGAPL